MRPRLFFFCADAALVFATTQAGILLIVDALFAGKMPPRLRLIVVCQHVSRLLLVLHSGMSRERVANTVRAWNAYQKKLQATFQGPHGPLVM